MRGLFPTQRSGRMSGMRRCLCVLMLSLAVSGCDPQTNIRGPASSSGGSEGSEQAKIDFDVAMDFLDNFHRYDASSAQREDHLSFAAMG